jgi:hypothetical protein
MEIADQYSQPICMLKLPVKLNKIILFIDNSSNDEQKCLGHCFLT